MSTTQLDTREDFLHYCIVHAMEGGIDYWSDVEVYKWHDPGKNGEGNVRVDRCEIHEHDEKNHTITPEVIEKAIAALVANTVKIRPDLRKTILGASAVNDAGDIDSEAADVLVQIGLFGEIVYG